MNILPHKSWHVRTKANIAKVNKDEKLAKELEEKEKKHREAYEHERRLREMKGDFGHGDLESMFKQSDKTKDTSNVEHEKESKNEREQYEKKIGLLTYLFEKDRDEAKPWWADKRKAPTSGLEADILKKQRSDPLLAMERMKKRPLPAATVTEESVKVVKSGGSKTKKTIQDLRAERLKREENERRRTENLLKNR